MYYRVPHRFKFSRRFGRAICQYMLFSPGNRDKEASLWLPKEAISVHEEYSAMSNDPQSRYVMFYIYNINIFYNGDIYQEIFIYF